jgi:outer membrane protein
MKPALRALCTIAIIVLTAITVQAGDKVYTLNDAYHAAVNTNEIIGISAETVVQSDSRIDQAWTYLYPRLVAQSAYTRYNDTLGTAPVIFQPLEQVQAALILTQPLYTGGRTLAALRTAQTLRDASRRGFESTVQDTLLTVAQAFHGVIKAQKLVDISRRAVDRMERHKKVTEHEAATRRNKANMSSLLRATTLVSQARINLIRAEDGLKIARSQLSMVTRLPNDAALSEPEALKPSEETYDQLKAIALANRADYAGSRLNQKVAEENVTIVKGAHYPQLYAEAGVKYLNSQPETGMDATTYYGGLRLQIPIFEGGLMKAETSEARSKVMQAKLSTTLLERSIETEVLEAHITLQTVTAVLATAKLQLGYAKDNFDTVENLFGEGLLPSLSLIDAEQALSQAERELANAVTDQQIAILRLMKSIGTLGQSEYISEAKHATS